MELACKWCILEIISYSCLLRCLNWPQHLQASHFLNDRESGMKCFDFHERSGLTQISPRALCHRGIDSLEFRAKTYLCPWYGQRSDLCSYLEYGLCFSSTWMRMCCHKSWTKNRSSFQSCSYSNLTRKQTNESELICIVLHLSAEESPTLTSSSKSSAALCVCAWWWWWWWGAFSLYVLGDDWV